VAAARRADAVLLNNCRAAKGCAVALAGLHLPYLGYMLHGHAMLSMDLLPPPGAMGDARVLTISEEASAGIRRLRPDVQRIDVLHSGVDCGRFLPRSRCKRLAKSPWSAGDGGPVFGYCGRLSGEKALITMLDSFRLARESLPSAKLLMVGGIDACCHLYDEYWRAELRVLGLAINQMDLVGAVHITGAVPDPEAYYPLMDVFLLTSHFEGLPLVLLEALACEVPAVCTAVGAIPEVLAGGCGVAVPKRIFDMDLPEREFFAAEMVRVATAPERARMGHAGRAKMLADYSAESYRQRAVDYFGRRLHG
jgi:glycosyltransferase involved in cell wall biosynthesis